MFNKNSITSILGEETLNARERIIKAAIEEFALRSVEFAHVRTITQKAEVNVASVNYYFHNKENLYIEILKDFSEFIEQTFCGFYEEAERIIRENNKANARKAISDFIIGCISKFRASQVISSLIMIFIREQISPSGNFKYVCDTVYKKPILTIAKLMSVAGRRRTSEANYIVFAQSLWSNLHSYCSPNAALLVVHGWKEIGDGEIKIVEEALNEALEKTLGK